MLFILTILGLCLGSFLGVIIDRLPHGRLIIKGRSRCNFCKKTLQPHDLIPLISFLLAKGRCRYCKKKLSLFYPAIEIAVAVVTVTTFLWQPNLTLYPLYLLLFLSFLALLVIDFQHHLLPDQLVLTSLIASFGIQIVSSGFGFELGLAAGAGLVVAGFFLLLIIFTRGRGMGMGDVKLVFVMGILLKLQVFLAVYVAFLTGGICALILVLAGKKKFGQTIAFGPFLILGTIVTLFYGNDLIARFFPYF